MVFALLNNVFSSDTHQSMNTSDDDQRGQSNNECRHIIFVNQCFRLYVDNLEEFIPVMVELRERLLADSDKDT